MNRSLSQWSFETEPTSSSAAAQNHVVLHDNITYNNHTAINNNTASDTNNINTNAYAHTASTIALSNEKSLPNMPMDLEEYNTFFRTRLNLSSTDLAQSMSVRDKDWGGERLSSHNSNDVWSVGSRDWQTSLSDDSGFLLSEDSGMVADSNLMGFDYIPNFLTDSAEFLPVNITTSNVGSTSNPPQPPQSVNDKGPQGELAKQMTNNSLITDYSSYNTPSSFSKSDEDEILSPESSGIETSCESPVSMSEGNDEVKSHVPKMGMIFSCEEEAYKFYHKYAVEMGFKIRKGKVQRLSNGSLRKRYFFCSQQGFRSKKQPTKVTKYTRKETRTGCNAKIQITFENEKCMISQFISEHNHDLQSSTQRHNIDSSSKIPKADSLIQPIHEIRMAKEAEAGTCARFCDMNYSKHLLFKKMNSLQPEDAQGLIDYLKKLQVEDPSLFYTLQVDAESNMTNFFWRDSRSKIDYEYFGDVLILDTTFRTDRYDMICALFLGLNHHHQQVLFGCAFLLDESVGSFTWLLGTFMEVMGRRQPKTIFTTECPAISEAVEVTLPKSQHRLCKQFIWQNAKQYLSMYYGLPRFESHFHSCLFDCQSEGEFQSEWSSLLEQYNLHENPWLQNIFNFRTKRSYLFSKMNFCAGIHSIQGRKKFSISNVFQNRESEAMTLPEYVQKYEKAAEQQRREELLEDFYCSASEQELILNSPMEKQAANVYTPTMFIIFRRELIGSMSVPLKRITRKGTIVTFKVTEVKETQSIVEFNSQDSTITCSCKMFESTGILCVHALKVLNTRNIFQIPPQYILKRWTKFAKDGVVEDDIGEEIEDEDESSDRPLSLGKRKLMHKALTVITKSVAVEKTQKIAEHYLDIAIKEVDDVLKKGHEYLNMNDAEVDHEDVSNTIRVARVERREKVVKDLYLNEGETSKGRMESQIQKKRKSEVREMDLPSSSMNLP